MGTIYKNGSRWRAQVERSGIRQSGTFDTKREAQLWAAKVETEIVDGVAGKIPDKTVADLLQEYASKVSAGKKGERWELLRIGLLCRDKAFAGVKLANLDARDVAAWRDRRLTQVQAGSVRREMNLIGHAFSIAVKEWKWLRHNPLSDVRRPAPPKARDRRIDPDEIRQILKACGYKPDETPDTAQARVGAAFLFAIETGMRAGEIAGLAAAHLNLSKAFVRLPMTKNGFPRDVPLSPAAVAILKQLPTDDPVFGLTAASLDALFRKARGRTPITDMVFHDTRHEAITRLASKLDVLELARMVGHKDLKQLLVYYNKSAEDIAKKL
jgi:integrase